MGVGLGWKRESGQDKKKRCEHQPFFFPPRSPRLTCLCVCKRVCPRGSYSLSFDSFAKLSGILRASQLHCGCMTVSLRARQSDSRRRPRLLGVQDRTKPPRPSGAAVLCCTLPFPAAPLLLPPCRILSAVSPRVTLHLFIPLSLWV